MQEITKAFKDYYWTIKLITELGRFKHDSFLKRTVDIYENNVFIKKRIHFIRQIEFATGERQIFIVNYKGLWGRKKITSLFIFEDFTKNGHFLFFLPPSIRFIKTTGVILNFDFKDFELLPFLNIQDISIKSFQKKSYY